MIIIMNPFICHALVILIWTAGLPLGNSLKCHYCESYGSPRECLKTSDEICKPGQDVCAIQTTWKGSLFNDMTMVKSCSTSNDCPPSNQTSPSCHKYESGWSCTLCCRENFCNTGANGKVPRPPPYPPVPDPLIRRLTEDCGMDMDYCTTTLRWSEEFGQVQINKQCTAGSRLPSPNVFDFAEKCNIPADPGYCVTCCQDDSCHETPTPELESIAPSYQQLPLLLSFFIVKLIS